VDCYRNLNKAGYFSCRKRKGEFKGLVVGYSKIIVLKNPKIVVNLRGRDRVISSSKKNVHSFVTGSFYNSFDGEFVPSKRFLRATYNPYYSENFFERQTKKPILSTEKYSFAVLHGSDVFFI
jgi:hypothetical protein